MASRFAHRTRGLASRSESSADGIGRKGLLVQITSLSDLPGTGILHCLSNGYARQNSPYQEASGDGTRSFVRDHRKESRTLSYEAGRRDVGVPNVFGIACGVICEGRTMPAYDYASPLGCHGMSRTADRPRVRMERSRRFAYLFPDTKDSFKGWS
jgi:hypothetical protein